MLTMEVQDRRARSSTIVAGLPVPLDRGACSTACPAASTATPSVDPATRRRPCAPASAAVDVEVRAEVASRPSCPIDEVLALQPGDVLRFGVPAAERRDACTPATCRRTAPGPAATATAAPSRSSSGWEVADDHRRGTRSSSAESTGDADRRRAAHVLRPTTVERGAVAVVPTGRRRRWRSIPVPAVAADVSYVDGVTGGNIFVDDAPRRPAGWPRR